MQRQDDLTRIYTNALYPARNPGAPRGQVSQPIYTPGRLTSAAQLSEQLPPGLIGGATEVSRGLFGKGSNVLVPRASSTVTIQQPPKPPVDSGAPPVPLVIKEPSGAGSSQLLDAGDGRVAGDAVALTGALPSAVATQAPVAFPVVMPSFAPTPPPSGGVTNPIVMYGLVFAALFAALMFAFKRFESRPAPYY